MDSEDCFLEHLYGTHSENTHLLRCLRDTLLVKSKEGREIVRLYEQYNSQIIGLIKADPDLRKELKEILDRLLPFINLVLDNSIIQH